MKSKLFQVEYYDTYYYAHLLDIHLEPDYEYADTVDNFFIFKVEPHKFLAAFQKFSTLHQFLEYFIKEEIYDEVSWGFSPERPRRLMIENALKHFGLEYVSFEGWLNSKGYIRKQVSDGLMHEYLCYLYDRGPLRKLLDILIEEIFFVMFMNRYFLSKFNERAASYISEIKVKDLPRNEKHLLKSDGILHRRRIPVWARRAIFYRDRGLCGFCQKDISGLLGVHSEKHYDHIVPLARGGMNDITNLQLLCGECNLGKRHRNTDVSNYYERWYR